MKKVMMTVALLTVAGFSAHADGFRCTSESGLNITVYNHTQAAEGTRTAAIMVVSDPSVGDGNHTIATFPDAKGVLQSSSQVYTGDVDLRMSGSNKAGRLIGGTKLGELDQIVLNVEFSYNATVADGEEIAGDLTMVKRNGQELKEVVNCVRYLKN